MVHGACGNDAAEGSNHILVVVDHEYPTFVMGLPPGR